MRHTKRQRKHDKPKINLNKLQVLNPRKHNPKPTSNIINVVTVYYQQQITKSN